MKIDFNFNKRIKSLRGKFDKNNIDSYLLNKKERIYYLTGYINDDSYLLLTKGQLYLITDSRYQEEVKNRNYNFIPIISNNKIKEIGKLISKLRLKRVGFEQDYLSYKIYSELIKLDKKTKFIPSQDILDDIMMIKDPDEIKAIKRAIYISQKAFNFFKRMRKVGKTEKEIANRLDYYIQNQLADRGGFDTMVIADKRSASPHASSSSYRIRKESNLLIDLGVKSYEYNSDLTRVFHLSKMSKRFKKILKVVKRAQSEAIKAIRPRVEISKIDLIIHNFFKSYNLDKYFIHASGHGIGLMVHEKPFINSNNNNLLKEGMVFTIEPGIYLPDEFGIRLEDMVLVTKEGCEVLSCDIPESI